MEAVFRSSEIVFFKVSLIVATGNGFSVNCKHCAFIQSSFLLVDTILEITCRPIFEEEHSCSLKVFSWIFEKSYEWWVSLKNGEKKWFPLARRSVSSNRNKLPLAGVFFKNWTLPNFNNGFY